MICVTKALVFCVQISFIELYIKEAENWAIAATHINCVIGILRPVDFRIFFNRKENALFVSYPALIEEIRGAPRLHSEAAKLLASR
jgi:hypothetical protein